MSEMSEMPKPAETHDATVERQFGARAEAYLQSPVHARGMGLEELTALARAHPHARMLDLGCGGGHVSFAAAPHLREVVATDLSPRMLAVVAKAAAEKCLTNLVTRECPAEALPFEDASFDLVMSRVSAHHWGDLEAGLHEAARVLKPGGTGAFVDSVSPGQPLLDTWFQSLELLRDTSHVRNYAPGEWQAALTRAGLVPTAMQSFRVRLDFESWVARMATPPELVTAIRALQACMPEPVARHYALEPDGSFAIDIALFEARKPG